MLIPAAMIIAYIIGHDVAWLYFAIGYSCRMSELWILSLPWVKVATSAITKTIDRITERIGLTKGT